MSDEIKLLPSVRQMVHTKLAQFCKESLGSDLYFLMEAFELLRYNVGNEPLKEYYKNDYSKLNQYLSKLSIRYNKVKMYYDSLPKLDDRMRVAEIKKLFDSQVLELPLISKPLFNSFDLLLRKTEIKFLPIPKDFLRTVEKTNKILERPEEERSDVFEG